MSENNLYTVEAFNEYFEHLKPDGFLAITRWEFAQPREALRVVSQEIEAFRRIGVDDVRRHFMVVAHTRLDQNGSQVTVLAKKTPFTIEEERIVLKYVQATPEFFPLYTPHVYGESPQNILCGAGETANCMDGDLAQLAENRLLPAETTAPFRALITLPSAGTAGGNQASPRRAYIRDYPFEIGPVTDDAPYFFFTFKTRQALRALLMGTSYSSIDWKNNLGLVVLGMMVIISVLAVLAFLIGPLAFCKAARKEAVTPLLYFVAIGLGYILVEIALIQRFVLFLGHPAYALTVVVFLMLFSSGIGSLVSKRWLHHTRRVRLVLGAIAGFVILYVFALHALLNLWVGWPFAEKLMLSAVALLPVGFLMGMPFPTGLRAMVAGRGSFAASGQGNMAVEWAWALNAASSVLGSVLAIVLSMHFGLNMTLVFAVGAYLLAAALTFSWGAPPRPVSESETDAKEPEVLVTVS